MDSGFSPFLIRYPQGGTLFRLPDTVANTEASEYNAINTQVFYHVGKEI